MPEQGLGRQTQHEIRIRAEEIHGKTVAVGEGLKVWPGGGGALGEEVAEEARAAVAFGAEPEAFAPNLCGDELGGVEHVRGRAAEPGHQADGLGLAHADGGETAEPRAEGLTPRLGNLPHAETGRVGDGRKPLRGALQKIRRRVAPIAAMPHLVAADHDAIHAKRPPRDLLPTVEMERRKAEPAPHEPDRPPMTPRERARLPIGKPLAERTAHRGARQRAEWAQERQVPWVKPPVEHVDLMPQPLQRALPRPRLQHPAVIQL